MSVPNIPKPVMLMLGLLYNETLSFEEVTAPLIQKFGPISGYVEPFEFHFTQYYKKEMGEKLMRSYLTFLRLIEPDTLSKIKLLTNQLEEKFLQNNNRLVNYDPGLLTDHNLILASCKDFSHRIYLTDGIFAEVTMVFHKGKYTFSPWTYPDYQSEKALDFFYEQRLRYIELRKIL